MNRHANGSARKGAPCGALVVRVAVLGRSALAQASERQYDIDIGAAAAVAGAAAVLAADGAAATLPSDRRRRRQTDRRPESRAATPPTRRWRRCCPTGFTFAWINARTISIVSPPANAPPGGVNEAVAAKDQQHSELSKEQQLSMANGGGKSGSARGPYAFDWKMTVEGRRIFDSVFDSLDLDIPVTVFDRRDIDALGVSTVTDLFRYVPQQPHTEAGVLPGRRNSVRRSARPGIRYARSCSSTDDGPSRRQVR